MSLKIGIAAVLLALTVLATGAAADQKSFGITLSTVSRIGDTEMMPGDYRVIVDGNQVHFTEVKTGREFEVEAKVEDAAQKAAGTEIHSQNVDGANRIIEIRIGGSKTRISFQ
jgi:hypothetical protein